MAQLYVVRRTFKAGGKLYRIGSIVEDLNKVHRARLRLREGKLIPLPKDKKDLERLHYYFKEKAGVDLLDQLAARASKGSSIAATNLKAAPPPQPPGTKTPKATRVATPPSAGGQKRK